MTLIVLTGPLNSKPTKKKYHFLVEQGAVSGKMLISGYFDFFTFIHNISNMTQTDSLVKILSDYQSQETKVTDSWLISIRTTLAMS